MPISDDTDLSERCVFCHKSFPTATLLVFGQEAFCADCALSGELSEVLAMAIAESAVRSPLGAGPALAKVMAEIQESLITHLGRRLWSVSEQLKRSVEST